MLRLAGFSSGRGDCARGGWSAGRCGSVAAVCLGSRLTLRFYWNVLPSVHACLFSFVRKKETACGVLRFYSAGRDRLRAFSQCRCSYMPLWVHFGFGCFFMAISTGYRGAEDGDTGPAARPLCVFAQPHWRCCAFRGEYAGAARPKPAPKSLRLSGLSSGAGRVRKCISRGGAVLVRIRAAVIRVHGKTRRTPIYGSAGRAV